VSVGSALFYSSRFDTHAGRAKIVLPAAAALDQVSVTGCSCNFVFFAIFVAVYKQCAVQAIFPLCQQGFTVRATHPFLKCG